MGRLSRFMAGRRGVDPLGFALMAVGVLLTLISSILSWFAMHPIALAVYMLLHIMSAVLLILAFFRMFSRNIPKREEENRRFLAWLSRLKTLRSRFSDRKTYRYLKCPGCKAQLRVPRGKGTLIVTCPKCRCETKIKT